MMFSVASPGYSQGLEWSLAATHALHVGCVNSVATRKKGQFPVSGRPQAWTVEGHRYGIGWGSSRWRGGMAVSGKFPVDEPAILVLSLYLPPNKAHKKKKKTFIQKESAQLWSSQH